MAALSYLWKSRAKFPITSAQFYRAWAKRVFSLPELIKRNYHRNILTKKGAAINETAEIGDAIITGIKKKLSINEFSFIGSCFITLHDKVTIGKNVCINDGVQILTASHDTNDPEWKHIKKEIFIEDYVWIATNAIILPGVHIGKGAVIGAGAVVSKNVLQGQIVAGNPAKPVLKERSKELNYNPCEFLAANRAWLVG
ncbi:MAG: acyltransferase [Paludibacter sp.]|nr:acyltransferase [Paludibacter sp.]